MENSFPLKITSISKSLIKNNVPFPKHFASNNCTFPLLHCQWRRNSPPQTAFELSFAQGQALEEKHPRIALFGGTIAIVVATTFRAPNLLLHGTAMPWPNQHYWAQQIHCRQQAIQTVAENAKSAKMMNTANNME